MKKSNYIRVDDVSHFKPLSEFSHNWGADHILEDLARKLSKDYLISEDKLMRLIGYVLSIDEIPQFIPEILDSKKIIEFEKDPEPINIIRFECKNKSFELTNPYIIDKLYSLVFSEYQEKSKERLNKMMYQNKKILGSEELKKKATEIFKELTNKENISQWKSYCIIGYIFAFFHLGIKNNEPIMTYEEYEIYKKTQYKTESYKSYLASTIKRYIIK